MTQSITSRVAQALPALADILTRQLVLCGRLEQVLQQEKMALIGGNGEQIATMTVEKRHLAQDIEELEQQRMDQLQEWAAELGSAPGELTLTTLIGYCPPDQARLLQSLQHDLQQQARRLRYLSQVNSALLHVSIDWLNQSLETYGRILRSALGGGLQQAAPAFVNIRI